MNKDTAIQRAQASRLALLKAIEGLSTGQRDSAPVEGIWTAKDLVGHICAWEESLVRPLRGYLENGSFTPEEIPDHAAWNALQAAQRAGRAFEQVLQEAISTRSELFSLAKWLAPSDWARIFLAPWGGEATLAQMIDGLAWHEEEHTRSIASLHKAGDQAGGG